MANKVAAVIELASGELRFKAAQKYKDTVKPLEYMTYPLSLGKDTFHSGKISPQSIAQTAEIINGYVECAEQFGKVEIATVATTAVREASNMEYFINRIKVKTGLDVYVADESEEKSYINTLMFGILPEEITRSAVAVHIGSGNITISHIDKSSICYMQSIKIGGLRLSEMFDEVGTDKYFVVVREYMKQFLDTIVRSLPEKIENVILTGYDVNTIAELCGSQAKGGIFEIDRSSFVSVYRKIKSSSPSELYEKNRISIDKQEMLLPSLLIYNRILKYTGSDRIYALDLTAGDAMLWNMLQPQIYSSLRSEYEKSALAAALLQAKRFELDEDHLRRIEECALLIYDKIKRVHGMGKRERFLLRMLVRLHNIGKFINPKSHYEHSYNIISGLDLVGVSDKEQNLLAVCSLFHSSVLPDKTYACYDRLSLEDRILVSKLCAILRLAVAVNCSHVQKHESVSVSLKDDLLVITLNTYKEIELEKWSFNTKKEFFTEVFGVEAVLKKKSLLE